MRWSRSARSRSMRRCRVRNRGSSHCCRPWQAKPIHEPRERVRSVSASMRYPEYPTSPVSLEETVLARWRSERLFEQTQEQSAGAEEFVFYEGPPTANGRPGIHHVISRTIKDRKSTRLNSSHVKISYAVFCLKKKNQPIAQGGAGQPGEEEPQHHPIAIVNRQDFRALGVNRSSYDGPHRDGRCSSNSCRPGTG